MWGGISYQGPTRCCVFTGIMDSISYQQILKDCLLPFTARRYPNGFRLYQDNDAKHKSKSTTDKDNGVSTMSTPPSSPYLNPIENVWATLKDHLKRKVKPKTKVELVNGIKDFWGNLTAVNCAKYIDHSHRVLPHVVLNDCGPTNF
ncbi:hypothetical protein DPMN_183760 [Dreissena polymorpha]|uniref:Tc1-like transposase DDE domain-containing protein n=1 Tax=Dreissena polymorpha TaxID=45954 RepID=A0A9D4DI68_DREPO|nr:hypothetical protein DPMN_183760 [Dreissena polymorpha]